MFRQKSNKLHKVIFMWRLIVTAYMLVFAITCLLGDMLELKYYTKQSFIITLFYFVFALSYGDGSNTQSMNDSNFREESSTTSARSKVIYILACLAINGSFIATFGFWVFLAPHAKDVNTSIFAFLWFGVNPHGISFALISIDIFLFTKVSFKLTHFYIALMYTLGYMLFSFAYYALGNGWIYPFLEWGTKMAFVSYPLFIVLVVLTHLFMSAVTCSCKCSMGKGKEVSVEKSPATTPVLTESSSFSALTSTFTMPIYCSTLKPSFSSEASAI
eukprot:MONOS_422.1-p1 / transcript=MONOS_422.1 / gene=MONOS_422 / organism=Monocercomonoides_exilis_PA203 / gene_product=unspecified product / transcript_product=unspecified product / location=Mono_scaffold00007:32253-33249(+) / protein_length=273 / sequence_SO=supercontig / SO=protein_coding / is_pseudo=false